MASHDPDGADDGPSSPMTRRERFTGAVSNFMLKPAPPGKDSGDATSAQPGVPTTIPEIEAAIK
jgi:hypothetical protein